VLPSGPGEENVAPWTVESETEDVRMESCDHGGTTEPLAGTKKISTCTACGKTWPARFGAGAPTVRIVSKNEEGA
jgi:hypothetical protein